jgi:pilus assembly protein CpaE
VPEFTLVVDLGEPEPGIQHEIPQGVPRRQPRLGRVIAVISGKGGVGKSALVANLACAIARDFDLAVAVADLSLQFGDQALRFDKPPFPSLADVLANTDAMSAEFLLECMHTGPEGIRILAAPPSPELADLVQPAHVQSVVAQLRRAFDIVLLDTSSHLSETTLEAIEVADMRVILTTPHLSALKDTKLLLRTLADLKVPASGITLILNRVEPGIKMGVDVLEANLRFALEVDLPHVGPALAEAAIDGVPLVLARASSDWSKKVIGLADLLAADESGPAGRKRKRGFLGLRRA